MECIKNQKIIHSTLKYMVQNFHTKISLDELASHLGITKFYLCRIFKDDLKVSPICWLWKFRIFISAEIICQRPVYPLHVISKQCGFTNPGHFAKFFKKHLNIRPSSLKKNMMKQGLTTHSKILYKSLYDVDLVKSAFEKTMSSINQFVDVQLFDIKYLYVHKPAKKTSSYPVRL